MRPADDLTVQAHIDYGYSSAASRWAGLGPYYAMFPVQFAYEVVDRYSLPGQRILDPFAGRGSSVFAAATRGRAACGIEINSVGWLFSSVKLRPAARSRLIDRLHQINSLSQASENLTGTELPRFFEMCFSPQVLRFLQTARSELQWRTSRVDATLMAIILVHLHGKKSQSFSNQMRQGKALSPQYCVNWWRENNSTPPDIDPKTFLLRRIEWRYAKGIPIIRSANVILGDCLNTMGRLQRNMKVYGHRAFNLLFTSPPYFGVANYYYDQWLRLWMLRGPPQPHRTGGPWQSKFESIVSYKRLMELTFIRAARLMASDATIYVRADARPFALGVTASALTAAFPAHTLRQIKRPLERKSQTALFGDDGLKPGEVDLIMQPM